MKLYSIEEVDGKRKAVLSLHQAQAEVWDSQRRFTFLLAGTQAGKTSFGPWWLWREIQKCGQGDYLAVTATYDLFKLKLLPEMRQVFEHVLGVGRYWTGERVLELKDPSTGQFWATRADDSMWGRIILRSAQAAGGLESATALAAWLDEVGQDDFSLVAWEAVLRRLSLSQGPVLGTTTLYNRGWLKNEVFERWKAGDRDYLVIQADSTVNPAFPEAEFERARRIMPDWKFAMFYKGQYATPAGLIYGAFDDDIHLVNRFAIPKEWPRYVGIDFGAVNTALLWIAEDMERAAYYVYRESLEGGMTTAEHAARALGLALTERVVRWTGGSKSETQQRWDWQAAGVPVDAPPVGDVESGIDAVYSLLKQKQLFVFRDLVGLRDELGTYSRVLDNSGQPTEKIKDKERFHRLDALRYGVLGMLGPEPVEEGVWVYDDPVVISPV